ncbi:GNAT family N-acetyltransferase [Streptococcus hongkongensis]|nr:GNAT family acetyltransferase [Streptococcus uberis]
MISIIYSEDSLVNKQVASEVLHTLPEWFGIEESTQTYIESASTEPCLIAYENDEIIGFISIYESNDFLEIDAMGVKSKYHQRGVGRQLITNLIEYARLNNYSKIVVKTLSDKHPDENYRLTRLFYQKLGFVNKRELIIWGEKLPCTEMELEINQKTS